MNHSCTIHWDEISPKQWNHHLSQAPYVAYQQHMAYGKAMQWLGARTLHATIERDGQVIGVVQFLVRRIAKLVTIAIALRGPVWLTDIDDDIKASCYLALKRTIPLRFPKFVLFMPETDDHAALKQAKLKRVVSSYSTVVIDLTQDEETLLAAMEGKWRNRLNAVNKQPITIEPVSLKQTQYQWLLDKEAEQAGSKGYHALTTKLVPLYQQAAGKDSLLILRAVYENETVGGVLMLIHGKSATYHIGWSNDVGKKLGAHNLLLWQAIQKLKTRNVHTLDLGGINTEPAGAGIARFKLGLSDHLVQLPGTYM